MDAEGCPPAERPMIIPKIEKPAALRNIDEILALSDGLMVAHWAEGARPPLEHTAAYARPVAPKGPARSCTARGAVPAAWRLAVASGRCRPMDGDGPL